MRESKKDKRDHKYGKLHRKDRQLHDEFKKKANAIWRKYLEEYVDTGKIDRDSYEATMAYYNARNAASDIFQKIEELWKESGLDWPEGAVELCRYRRYHGHSNHGYVHADFIKKRVKEFERIDREDAMEKEG